MIMYINILVSKCLELNVMEREKTEFNMAVSYLNRINALFYIADEAAMALDINSWFHALLCLFRELSTELKPDEIAAFNIKIAAIRNDINIEGKKMVTKFNTLEISPKVYNGLHDFEISMRKVMKEAGLQMKMQDDASHLLK